MKSRVPSPVPSSSPMKKEEPAFYRYLKPGALARIRDSKYTSKSKGRRPSSQDMDKKLNSSSSTEMVVSQTTQTTQMPVDSVPSFPCSGIGQFSPSGKRKKLSASAPTFSDSPNEGNNEV